MNLLETLTALALLIATLFLGVYIGNKTRVVEAKASPSCWSVTNLTCEEK